MAMQWALVRETDQVSALAPAKAPEPSSTHRPA
jgi:hypothetical protein